ncbi:MAG: hypothetical protein ACKVRP_13800 [Bacteroidota bacterium]
MLTKTDVRISRRDWEKLRKNPSFSELIELLEDDRDLQAAKRVRGKDLMLQQYLTKRGIRNNH